VFRTRAFSVVAWCVYSFTPRRTFVGGGDPVRTLVSSFFSPSPSPMEKLLFSLTLSHPELSHSPRLRLGIAGPLFATPLFFFLFLTMSLPNFPATWSSLPRLPQPHFSPSPDPGNGHFLRCGLGNPGRYQRPLS